MTRAEKEYTRVQQFIAATPKRERSCVSDCLVDYVDDLQAAIFKKRNPSTLDDIRAWGSDMGLAEYAICELIDRYADEKYGYEEYCMLPVEEWPEYGWCPDWYCERVMDFGGATILANESLHTIGDLVAWLDAKAGNQDIALTRNSVDISAWAPAGAIQ